MKLPRWISARTPLGRWVFALALVLAALAIWWLVSSLTSGSTAKVEARLGRNQAEATLASGSDAVETVGRSIAYERHVDVITRETERVIRQAPGAAAPVDPDLHRLALDRLCQRAAYREQPDCMQPSAAP